MAVPDQPGEQRRLFAGLPLQATLGFPFSLNAQFNVDTARSGMLRRLERMAAGSSHRVHGHRRTGTVRSRAGDRLDGGPPDFGVGRCPGALAQGETDGLRAWRAGPPRAIAHIRYRWNEASST